jgi:hypothetical protein
MAANGSVHVCPKTNDGSTSELKHSQNTCLLYGNIDILNDQWGIPDQYSNLTKPWNIPSSQGGALWPDTVNKVFYLYGGEHYDDPVASFELWLFDNIANTWNRTYAHSSQDQMQRASFGASAIVDDRGLACYYGGWLSSFQRAWLDRSSYGIKQHDKVRHGRQHMDKLNL